jgi:1,2-phenylacetyl-CoA epoxidase catalytic subunit
MTVDLTEQREQFFAKQRDPDQLARLFAIFRVGEHHAVITIGDWLKSAEQLEVKNGFARLIWDEARHTSVWTDRMTDLIGEDAVRRLYPDPRQVDFRNDQYFRLWDEYARAETLPQRLAYIYVVDGWAAMAYDTYLKYVDPVTKWHLQTILHDEQFHVGFGQKMAEKYVTSGRDREILQREEEKILKIIAEISDGFLRTDV